MQTGNFFKLTALCAVLSASVAANAAPVYDANVTNNVIMGSGIANGGFTVNTGGGVEVALRAHERHDLVTNLPSNVTGSNGNGTYNQNAGEPPGFPGATQNRARWNFDWSINTGAASVGRYTYRLGMDFDAGVGTNFQIFDPINLLCADHSFGNNSTLQSAGTEVAGAASNSACAGAFAASDTAQYATLLSNNLVQNSWNLDFFDNMAFPFDPTVNGTYSFFLEAISAQGLVTRTDIDVIVGTGAVPEPGSLALIGLALAGLAVTRRRA